MRCLFLGFFYRDSAFGSLTGLQFDLYPGFPRLYPFDLAFLVDFYDLLIAGCPLLDFIAPGILDL